MSSITIIQLIVLLGAMLVLMLLRVPVFLSMILSSAIFMIVYPGSMPVAVIGQGIVSGINNISFAAIAFYFMLGEIMNSTGLSERLVAFLESIVGHIRGSLSHINIIASMVFAGVSGSSVADTASIGSLMIPMMKKQGYPAGYAAAVTEVSSIIGPIIPPSGTFILMAIYFNCSVRKMFIGGIIPGLLIGLFGLIISFVISKRRNFPKTDWRGWRFVGKRFKEGFAAFLLPVIVMVCLLTGIGTVIEIGSFSCIVALILARLYERITLKDVFKMLVRAANSTATITILLSVAGVFNWLIASLGVSNWIAGQLKTMGTSTFVVVGFCMVVLFFLGMILDNLVLQTVIVPVMAPTILALGIDPIWFGVVATLVIMIGLNTPPVGGLIYMTASIAKCPSSEVIKESLPFIAGNVILVAILLAVPQLVSFLPSIF